MASMFPIIHNEKNMRFEIHEGDEIAFIEFRYSGQKMALMHTFVPAALEGKGVASALAQHAFAYAKAQQKPVIVYCSYVLTYLKRHPELAAQLASNS